MRTITVNASKKYDIVIGKDDVLPVVGEKIKSVLPRAEKILLVSENSVFKLYGGTVKANLVNAGFDVTVYKVAGGEDSKSMRCFNKGVTVLAEKAFKRTDAVVALGGGVVGDLAGFIASAYMRGIAVVQIPTTLLAMVDSSVGGKTAVNLPQGKNLVGAFHQPSLVLADMSTLDTLTEEIIKSGIGEIAKYAVLCGGELFDIMSHKDIKANIGSIVYLCVECKKKIVESDEREGGVRKLLNLGHTFGHAYEKLSGFKTAHGVCVAKGIYNATDMSVGLGLLAPDDSEKIKQMLCRLNFAPDLKYDLNDVAREIAHDKKAVEGGKADFVFVETIGKCVIKECKISDVEELLKDNLTVCPSQLKGYADNIPASKSDAHRALIASALSDHAVNVSAQGLGVDISATKDCLKALGATIVDNEKGYLITPPTKIIQNAVLDCRESGSTLRFMLPVAAALGATATFIGSSRLGERPLKELIDVLKSHGISFDGDKLPLKINGKLTSGEYRIAGNVSSQYISGLMLALSAVKGKSVIITEGGTVSKGYIKMTERVLKKYGAAPQIKDNEYVINGKKALNAPKFYAVEQDGSSAAFYAVAAAVCGEISFKNFPKDTAQGDAEIFEILKKFGADVKVGEEVTLVRADKLKGIELDITDIPDLAPVLSIAAARAEGKTVFRGVDRLKAKESDRLLAISEMLTAFGISYEYKDDTLTVYGGALHGGVVNGHGDHRMVMAAAVGGLIADGKTEIIGARAVNKSYPDFFEDYVNFGGKIC